MHWVLQENLHQEPGYPSLVLALERAQVPFSQHKVVPFSGDLIPDISPEGPVIAMGTYSLCRTAKRKGWKPGVFDVGSIPWKEQVEAWGINLLNVDGIITTFGEAAPTIDPFFMRPLADTKEFAGTIMFCDELLEWQHKVRDLGMDCGDGLRANTPVLWAWPKGIDEEYRLWIVGGKVITASRYRPISRTVPAEAIVFGQRMADIWHPLPAFVMDVCHSKGIWWIVEINTLNASGFYAAELDKIVDALERLWPSI